MLTNLFNKTVTIKRLSTVTGTNKETWQTVTIGTPAVPVSIACAIHPVDGSQSEMLEGGFFNTFKMFCATGTDIQIGDLVVDGSDTYTVKAKKDYSFAGSSSIKHLNIILVKKA